MRVRRLLRAAVLFIPWVCLTGEAVARDLSFEERVKAQEAIERVYYSHQIGATQHFEEAAPQEVLERRVRTYLKQSVALERFWRTPVTAELLRKETLRMGQKSRMPERLRELYAALGNDRFLFEETVARAALVDRLSRHFYAFDERLHTEAYREVEILRRKLLAGGTDFNVEGRHRVISEFVLNRTQSEGARDFDVVEGTNQDGRNIKLSFEEFGRARRLAPRGVGEIGPVVEERDSFRVCLLLEESAKRFRMATFVVPKKTWEEFWDTVSDTLDEKSVVAVSDPSVSVPSSPASGTFGSTPGAADLLPQNGSAVRSAVSCPTDDRWDNGSLDDIPDPRQWHSAVWTGSRMLVWGGRAVYGTYVIGGSFVNTGATYDPATDTWTVISTRNAPLARYGHTAIWTGDLMIIWGGVTISGAANTGGRYDPVNDSWTPTNVDQAPDARSNHTAVWTGSLMLIWGGDNSGQFWLTFGARYDPSSDTWTWMSAVNEPSPRSYHTAIWTGSLMIVWGGTGPFPPYNFNTGGRYDPVSDIWSPTSTIGAPANLFQHTAVWTGNMMVVWGHVFFSAIGGRYDPISDTWAPTSSVNAPSERGGHIAVWTGSVMVVWGGRNSSVQMLKSGGRYDPANDSWLSTSTLNAPEARESHTAVWTGSRMIVWGGNGQNFNLNTGGRYDPASDSWTPTTTGEAPESRLGHTAVWTGNEMVIWGGTAFRPVELGLKLNSGGRYDPATDAWTPTSTNGAPAVRSDHTAVWTGQFMIVWGGTGSHAFNEYLNTGGRYDPVNDAWLPVSTTNSPGYRTGQTAVWTGEKMIVWGGTGHDQYAHDTGIDTGGLYDPATDAWHPTSRTNAPTGRWGHTAVWTGQRMIVWGGATRNASYYIVFLDTGGLYDPSADSWMPTSRVNAPAARPLHSAVWVDDRMVIWGGIPNYSVGNTGGRYDPESDTWMPISTAKAPQARRAHTAVSDGDRMIVWGGSGDSGLSSGPFFESGARYDPRNDTWKNMSTFEAPLGRYLHTAVWTGEFMVVWGGSNNNYLSTGGLYCSCTAATYYQDSDGDGFGDLNVSFQVCSRPDGYVSNGDDCDDSKPAIHPDAVESCDGTDENCDGQIDEGFGVGSTCVADLDECHQVIGTRQCRPDGAGTQCNGDTVLHDTAPPVLSCRRDVTLECPATSGGIGFPVVTDTCDPSPQVVSDAPSTLPLGARVVTWLATDASGNHSSCQETIAVVDRTPPQLTLNLSSTVLWPPNHRMVTVQAAWQVTDTCDPTTGVILVSATSSEPDDAPGNGDGNTTGDIQDASIGTPDTMVLLRAERSGAGQGRVYTMTYAARDASGNTASALGIVTVPQDLGTGPEPVMINVEGGGTPGMVHLYWNTVSGAETYNLIRGDLDQITTHSGVLWLGPVRVLVSGIMVTSYTEGATGQVPAVGKAFFYLVQYRDGLSASGWGTESSPWPAEPTSCDVGCPGEAIGTSIASGDPLRK